MPFGQSDIWRGSDRGHQQFRRVATREILFEMQTGESEMNSRNCPILLDLFVEKWQRAICRCQFWWLSLRQNYLWKKRGESAIFSRWIFFITFRKPPGIVRYIFISLWKMTKSHLQHLMSIPTDVTAGMLSPPAISFEMQNSSGPGGESAAFSTLVFFYVLTVTFLHPIFYL